MNRNNYLSISALVILLSLAFFFVKINKKKTPPNVILLLVDDLGWRDVGYMGSQFYETPNIDRIAQQGMIFTDAYASGAICSPTRVAIQTGRYPARVGITDWIRARFQLASDALVITSDYEDHKGQLLRTPTNPLWMEKEEVTIAELLKDEGYFTCHIGKWHLGPDAYYPEQQGYDLNIAGCDMGQPANYFDPYSKKGVSFPTLSPRDTGEYLVDRLADELVNVIHDHKDKPFFINMNYYAVHTPVMGKLELVNKYEAKTKVDGQKKAAYAAMVESVDQAVGTLFQALEDDNLLDNTIIIFTSDNGGLIHSTSNKPLRAGKGYPYEGGIREPMFVYWQGKIQPGSSTDLPVSSIDILPTICAVTNASLPNVTIDGRDISPLFNDEKMTQVPLYWHYPHYRDHYKIHPYSIIRDGDWKLIKRYDGNEFELFNLADDLGESNDVSPQFPDKVKGLNTKLERWLDDTNAKMPILKK